MPKFSFKKVEELTFVTFYFEGIIDESFSLSNLKSHPNKAVKVDCQKITSINSMGIRNWILWINSNPKVKYTFTNCPVCIIEQINAVKGFIPSKSIIESFDVPYFSESTGEEKHVLYELKKDFRPGKNPTIKSVKDSTGMKMELDVAPQKYFKFLVKGI